MISPYKKHIKNKLIAFKVSPIAASLLFLFLPHAFAALHFDPNMISDVPGAVADLTIFEKAGGQLPGEYPVAIYINGKYIFSQTVKFISLSKISDRYGKEYLTHKSRDHTGLIPVFSQKEILSFGVRNELLKQAKNIKPEKIAIIADFVPDAFTSFNFQTMRLNISIPQASLKHQAHGWVSPELWEEGENAGLLSYQFSGSQNKGAFGNSNSHFLSLTSGLNIGAWRIRDDSTWNDYRSRYSQHSYWKHIRTYVQRSVIPVKSELTIGDSSTDSDIFDPVSYRGVQIATDDSMYPDTMRGYAPVIRGIAATNAQVTVRQNKNIIYRTSVASGAFVINDLYPVSAGGDLEVTVTEAGGKTKVLVVPYSSVPVLQREGHLRYSITVGQYRNEKNRYSAPSFLQGTLLWGLTGNITAYGGYQLSANFQSVAAGAGLNMGQLGAMSADLTQANSTLVDGSRHHGESLRFLYGRSLLSTGTTLQLAGYRYSTSGFHTLDETALTQMSGWLTHNSEVDVTGKTVKPDWMNYYDLYSNKRQRLQANLSQQLSDTFSLYLTANHQSYWRSHKSSDSLQTGLSTTLDNISCSLSYGYTKVRGEPEADKIVFFSVSIPLSQWLKHSDSTVREHHIWSTYTASRSSGGDITHQVGLSGTALEEDNFYWGASQGYSARSGNNGDLSMSYSNSYGSVSAGFGYDTNYTQLRYSASGSAIIHSGGLTFGRHLGNTNVLIEAPGAKHIKIENGNGIYTDWRGYAVIPYARIYTENRIALDTSTLDENTELNNPVIHVTPTRGAVVKAKFVTSYGARKLIRIIFHGKPLPFGTTVNAGQSSGLVSEAGYVYLSGLQRNNLLRAKWGNKPDQQCSVHLTISEKEMNSPLSRNEEICQ